MKSQLSHLWMRVCHSWVRMRPRNIGASVESAVGREGENVCVIALVVGQVVGRGDCGMRVRSSHVRAGMETAVGCEGEVKGSVVACDMGSLVRLALVVWQVMGRGDCGVRVRSSYVGAGMETAVGGEGEVECGVIAGDMGSLMRIPLPIWQRVSNRDGRVGKCVSGVQRWCEVATTVGKRVRDCDRRGRKLVGGIQRWCQVTTTVGERSSSSILRVIRLRVSLDLSGIGSPRICKLGIHHDWVVSVPVVSVWVVSASWLRMVVACCDMWGLMSSFSWARHYKRLDSVLRIDV